MKRLLFIYLFVCTAAFAQGDSGLLCDSIVTRYANGSGVKKTENFYYDNGLMASSTEYKKCENGIWTPTSSCYKYDYEYDAKGNKTQTITYRWENNQWNYSSKLQTTYDAYGYEANIDNYEWNGEQWVLSYHVEYTHNANGRETSSCRFTYINGELAFWDNKQEHIYDSNGNMICDIVYLWQNEQWVLYTKTDYSFDTNGNFTDYSVYEWKNNQWVNKENCEYSCDSNGNITRVYNNWQAGQWVPYSKYEETYDAKGNRKSVTYDWQGGQWVPSSKNEEILDENTGVTTLTLYSRRNGEWFPYMKYENVYDDNGNPTVDAYYFTDYDNGWIGQGHKYERTYDADGNITIEKRYKWNKSDKQWEYQSTHEYTYDISGNLTCEITSGYSGYNEEKTEYIRNVDGDLLSEIRYYMRGDQWEVDRSTIYYYSENTTGIESATIDTRMITRKFIDNGIIRIVNGKRIYTVSGQRIK